MKKILFLFLILVLVVLGVGIYFLSNFYQNSTTNLNSDKSVILEDVTKKFEGYGDFGDTTKREITYSYKGNEFNVQVITFEDDIRINAYYDFQMDNCQNQEGCSYKNRDINGKKVIFFLAKDIDSGKNSQIYIWKSDLNLIIISFGQLNNYKIQDDFAEEILENYVPSL